MPFLSLFSTKRNWNKKADNTPQLINHLFVDLSFWHTFNNRSLIWWLQLQLHMNCHNIWHLTIVNTTITDCLKKFCSVVQKQWLCLHKSYIYLSDCFRSSFCDRSPFLPCKLQAFSKSVSINWESLLVKISNSKCF